MSYRASMGTDSTIPLARAAQLADQRALVQRARQGDASAHRALYDAHVDRIYRLVYRMIGVEHAAMDVTQDTFVRAFAGIDGFREDSAFSTWLHSIAVSLSLNELKRRKRDQSRNQPLDDAMHVVQKTPVSDPVLRERLQQAVSALPEGCRAVFIMHDAEGYTHEEIGAALGITDGASKAQLNRARGKLRVALAQFAGEWK